METLIYNIDSKDRNTTSYPNSHDFTYNKVDTTIDSIVRVEPFTEKNVIEINVGNVEIPNTFYFISSTKGNNVITVDGADYTISDGSYTKDELMTAIENSTVHIHNSTYSSTTGKVSINTDSKDFTFASISNYQSLGEILGYENGVIYSDGDTAPNAMTLPQEPYVFLKINDMGNIIHKDKRYVAKLVPDNSSRFDDINRETIYKTLSTKIVFDQPRDIKELKISLVDNAGNSASINNVNFSFNLEVKVISNSILKQFEQFKFYNGELMQYILNNKMLEYYQKQNNNNNLNSQYSDVIQKSHMCFEFDYNGNKKKTIIYNLLNYLN